MPGPLFWHFIELIESMRPEGPLRFERVANGLFISSPHTFRSMLMVD